MPTVDNSTSLEFHPIRNRARLKNLTGQVFGRLTVIGLLGRHKRHTWWLCRCACGRLSLTMVSYLLNHETFSCGCKGPRGRVTHGLSGTTAYKRWKGIRQRTGQSKGKNVTWYEGVTTCSGWAIFINFLNDMGEPPSARHQIDRRNNKGGYWCGHCEECVELGHEQNCQWVPPKVNSRNRSNNRIITYNSQSLSAAEWAERFNIPYKRFHRYLQCGWSMERLVAYFVS